MCLYNVRIDDKVFQSARPYFKGEDAMQAWVEKQLHNVFVQFIREQSTPKPTSEANDVLEKQEAIKEDPDGFFMLGGFMADSKSTAEELLDEALSEKYGI